VRQNQEAFVRKAFNHGIRHLFRGDRVLKKFGRDAGSRFAQHGGSHSLRTQSGDANSLVVVGDREPLRKREGSVLRYRVRRGSNLSEQACGGNRLQKVSMSARNHAGQHSARRIDMGFDVGVPNALPISVGDFDTAFNQNARVGTEQVDLSVPRFHGFNEPANIGFIRHVNSAGQIGRDYRPGAFGFEATAQRATDAVRSPGDYRYLVG